VVVLLLGAIVGHRALMRYYRQKLRPDRQIAIRRDTSAVSKVISHYKALGWTGTTGLKFPILAYIFHTVLVTS